MSVTSAALGVRLAGASGIMMEVVEVTLDSLSDGLAESIKSAEVAAGEVLGPDVALFIPLDDEIQFMTVESGSIVLTWMTARKP